MVKENVQVVYSVEDKGASKKIGLLSQGFQKLKDNAKLVAIAGIGALTAVIVKGLKAFGVQEKAIATLNQSLKNTGNYSKSASEDLQKFASGLQKITIFGDEQILQGQALIASFGFQGEQLKSLTTATADLAAAKGMDFVQAADLVAKAVGSETNALSRYGVQIEGAAGSTERATNAVKAMTAVFGGQAQAQAQTFAGSIQQLQNTWGDLSEEIGKVFAPMIQQVAGYLKGLVERFNGLSDPAKQSIVLFGAIGTAILVLLPLLAVLVTSIAAISWPVLAVIGAVGLLVAAFVKFKIVRDIVSTVGDILYKSFVEPIVKTIEMIKKLIEWFSKLKKSKDDSNKSSDSKEKKSKDEEQATKEEKKQNNLDNLAAEEDAKTELMLQKDAERNQALLDQQATQREEKKALEEELRAIDDEEELVRFEEKMMQNAERGELTTAQELAIEQRRSELKKANWQKEFGTWLGIEKLKLVHKQSTAQQMANWESFMANATRSKNKEVANIAKGLAIKDIAFKTAQAAMSAYSAMAAIPFVGPVLGALAAGAAIAFGAEQISNVNSQTTELADGGSMIVDQPTRIGNNVLAGEAGPERIDVTPLSEQQPQTVNNIIQLDGEVLARQVLKLGQGMRSEGTVDDGL